MKLKVNDLVEVITGKDKGKRGKILKIIQKKNKVVVEKINIRTKHIKKTSEKPGERIQFEAALDASNVMAICPETNKRSRLGYKKLETGKKERIFKKSKVSADTKPESFKKSKKQ